MLFFLIKMHICFFFFVRRKKKWKMYFLNQIWQKNTFIIWYFFIFKKKKKCAQKKKIADPITIYTENVLSKYSITKDIINVSIFWIWMYNISLQMARTYVIILRITDTVITLSCFSGFLQNLVTFTCKYTNIRTKINPLISITRCYLKLILPAFFNINKEN